MSDKNKILVGKIVGVQGLRGDVRVQTYSESPMDFQKFKVQSSKFNESAFRFVRRLNPTSSVIIAHIDGYDDRTSAESLRGTELYIGRDTLPPIASGEYYVADLMGMTVVKKSTNDMLGIVADVKNFGGGDILELDNGDMVLLDGADVDMVGKIIKVL